VSILKSLKEAGAVPTTAPELEYEFTPELQEQLRAYPGKWVLVTRTRLLSVGDSPAEAVRNAAGVEADSDPILKHIPRGGRTYVY
jgi:hypothetical protein